MSFCCFPSQSAQFWADTKHLNFFIAFPLNPSSSFTPPPKKNSRTHQSPPIPSFPFLSLIKKTREPGVSNSQSYHLSSNSVSLKLLSIFFQGMLAQVYKTIFHSLLLLLLHTHVLFCCPILSFFCYCAARRRWWCWLEERRWWDWCVV